MPVNSPSKTLALAERVVTKDATLGAGSPLIGFVDMAAFDGKRLNAKTFQKTGNERREDAQALYNQCAFACGLAKGQNRRTRSTVLWYVLKVRDVLLLKYRGTEEQMETFGFAVVVSMSGGRRYVRVNIPVNNPEELLQLADDIIEEDASLGGGSPLVGNVDVAAFTALTASANTLLNDWQTADEDAQAEHNEALAVMGYAAGQNAQTVGTIYYDLIAVRDRLLMFYEGVEEEMSRWGFKVVISEVLTGGKKGAVRVRKGKVEPESTQEIDLAQANVLPQSQFTLGNTGDTDLQYYFAEAPDALPNEFAVTVTPDQELLRTADELGLNIDRVYFNVHNAADAQGQYVLNLMR